MATRSEREAYEGLSQVAHAIRRSTALTVAMNITDPGSTEADLLACADRMAAWIGGKAAQQPDPIRRPPLGEPFIP